MNPAQLLAHFDRISEAPDAIPRLRRFILDLAVRGKLVEQDPNDEPEAELLKRIQAGNERQIIVGEIKKQGTIHEIQADEAWFNIPASWYWVRLGMITQVHMGQSPPGETYNKTGEGIPLINGPVEFTEGPFGKTVVNQYTTSPTNLCEEGDLLLCVRGSTTGRTNIAAFRACIGRGVAAIRPLFFSQYVHLFIWWLRPSIIAMGRGIAFPSVSRQQIQELPIPLPPLPEQHRIVAKVDELMALCDHLEAAKAERESQRDQLIAASLHHLNSSADADASREHARFYLNHLPRLTIRPEHIKQLRRTILNLAVRGRLVPQDPNDEPAATQLAISNRTRKEIAKQDRRADAGLQPLLAAEDRWEIPTSWSWLALADLVLFIDYRGQTPSKVDQGVRLITAKNIKKGFINLFPEEFLSETNYHTWMTRGFPKEGDILFTTEAPMGNAAVVRLSERFALAQRVICFRSYGGISTDFMVLQLLAEPFQFILDKTATGLTAKGIKAAKLKRLPIAIPPLAEQHRIVAKVDELMALCDQLETQLTTTQADSRRLLEVMLHRALGEHI